jgi:hypothetical protein
MISHGGPSVSMISHVDPALRPGSCHDVCRSSCPQRHVPAAHRTGLFLAPPFLSSSYLSLHITCTHSFYSVISFLAAIMKMLELLYYPDSPPSPLPLWCKRFSHE